MRKDTKYEKDVYGKQWMVLNNIYPFQIEMAFTNGTAMDVAVMKMKTGHFAEFGKALMHTNIRGGANGTFI